MGVLGIIVVIAAVLGGYLMEQGKVSVILQPAEFLIIIGAGLGIVLISTPPKLIRQILVHSVRAIRGERIDKNRYFELLALLYELFQTAKKDGILGLEPHVEEPYKSSIFSKYPMFLKNHAAVHFLTDTIKVIITGGVPSYEIEALMETDLETYQEESAKPAAVVSKVGDAMPGLGIVAAVLGIVITMQAIDGPPEVVGHKVGAALVGTFLGVLLSYGFLQPLAASMENMTIAEGRYIACIKAGLMAFAKDVPPLIAVEFARRSIYSDVRPTFKALETTLRGAKS